MRHHLGLGLTIVLLLADVARPDGGDQEISIPLGDRGGFMELDPTRDRLYVSVRELDLVKVISTATFEVERDVAVVRPYGLEVSGDGRVLYVGNNGHGTVTVINLESFETEGVFSVEEHTGDHRTFDLIEVTPDRLFVTASPGGAGSAYIGLFDPTNEFAGRRVASGEMMRNGPWFALDPAGRYLYVGESGGVRSLVKLDLAQDDVPLVLLNPLNHSSSRPVVSPDGERLYLSLGYVVRTEDFQIIGSVAQGSMRFGISPDRIYVSPDARRVVAYDVETFVPRYEIALPCDFRSARGLVVLPGDAGWLVFVNDEVCGLVRGIADCNDNGVADLQDIVDGTSNDVNGNDVPDECEACELADIDGSGDVGMSDLVAVLAFWGPCRNECLADVDWNGVVDLTDLLIVLSRWGDCDPS